jgi:hypothetical protein
MAEPSSRYEHGNEKNPEELANAVCQIAQDHLFTQVSTRFTDLRHGFSLTLKQIGNHPHTIFPSHHVQSSCNFTSNVIQPLTSLNK